MISRFYYSLTVRQDILHSTQNEFGIVLEKEIPQPEPFPPQIVFDRYAPINQEEGIYWLIKQLTGETVGEDTDITKNLLIHIWLNLYDKNVGYVDIKHPRWEQPSKPYAGNDYTSMKREFGNSIWSIYIDTKDYYETLIAMYNSELENLLNGVTTVTDGNGSTRFNDTPQNTPTTGGYAEDNYSTNVTTNNNTVTVTSDLNTKMARIDEVQRLLKNLYADWAFEFNKLILED